MFSTVNIRYPNWHIGRHSVEIWEEMGQVHREFGKTLDQFLILSKVIAKPLDPLLSFQENWTYMDQIIFDYNVEQQARKAKLTSFLLLDANVNIVTAEEVYPGSYSEREELEIHSYKKNGDRVDLDNNFDFGRVFSTYDALDLLRYVEERRLKFIFGDSLMDKKNYSGYDENTHYEHAFLALSQEVGDRNFFKEFLVKKELCRCKL